MGRTVQSHRRNNLVGKGARMSDKEYSALAETMNKCKTVAAEANSMAVGLLLGEEFSSRIVPMDTGLTLVVLVTPAEFPDVKAALGRGKVAYRAFRNTVRAC